MGRLVLKAWHGQWSFLFRDPKIGWGIGSLLQGVSHTYVLSH